MVGYHLAKALWMASHSSAHSDHKVLSAIGQSLKLGILGSIESKLCDRNKRLDALPYRKPLPRGIYACFQLCKGPNSFISLYFVTLNKSPVGAYIHTNAGTVYCRKITNNKSLTHLL